MDTLWTYILFLVHSGMNGLDRLLGPLNAIHPSLSILGLVVVTVFVTKLLRATYQTKRYKRLESEFLYWYDVRQQALASNADPAKAKEMAKNIDQSTLNKVYYDYFFEGLLNSVITTYLPILCIAGYINEAFKPQALQAMIGSSHLLALGWSGQSLHVTPLLLFVVSLIACYLGCFLWKRRRQSIHKRSGPDPSRQQEMAAYSGPGSLSRENV